MRRRFATLLVTCLVFGAYVTPVYAAKSQCSAGYFCEWNEINYSGGEFTQWGSSANDWPWLGIENDDDSVYNREAKRTMVYTGANWSGDEAYCVVPGGFEDDILGDRDNDGDSNFLHADLTTCFGWPLP